MRSSPNWTRFRGLHRLTASVLVLGIACSDSTGPSQEFVTPLVSATVAGSAWAANHQVSLAVGDLYQSQKLLDIVGLEIATNHAGRQITINLLNFTGPGTYTLGAQVAKGSWGYYIASPDVTAPSQVRSQQDVFYDTRRPGAGTVTVTSYIAATGIITGTFSIEMTKVGDPATIIQISNGKFAGRIAQEP